MEYTKSEVINKLRNDAATINDWKKSRKSFNDNDFDEYIDSVYEMSSESDINSFME